MSELVKLLHTLYDSDLNNKQYIRNLINKKLLIKTISIKNINYIMEIFINF